MKLSNLAVAWRSVLRAVSPLAAAAACWGAMPQPALAAQAEAYVIFETAADSNGAADRLRSASLGNCKQLVIGNHLQDVFVHIACDDGGNLDQAFLELSQVDGVVRATVISVTRGAD